MIIYATDLVLDKVIFKIMEVDNAKSVINMPLCTVSD